MALGQKDRVPKKPRFGKRKNRSKQKIFSRKGTPKTLLVKGKIEQNRLLNQKKHRFLDPNNPGLKEKPLSTRPPDRSPGWGFLLDLSSERSPETFDLAYVPPVLLPADSPGVSVKEVKVVWRFRCSGLCVLFDGFESALSFFCVLLYVVLGTCFNDVEWVVVYLRWF